MNLNPNAFSSAANPDSVTNPASLTGVSYYQQTMPSSSYNPAGNFFSHYPGSSVSTGPSVFLDHMSQMFPQQTTSSAAVATNMDLFYSNNSYNGMSSSNMYGGAYTQQYQPQATTTAQMFMKNTDQYGHSSASPSSSSSLSSSSSSSIASNSSSAVATAAAQSAQYFAQQFSVHQMSKNTSCTAIKPELFTPYLFNDSLDQAAVNNCATVVQHTHQQPQRTSSSSSSASSSSHSALNYHHNPAAVVSNSSTATSLYKNEHGVNSSGNNSAVSNETLEESSSNENSSPSNSKPPVIYAWMKKVHTNTGTGGKDNSGKGFFFYESNILFQCKVLFDSNQQLHKLTSSSTNV
jgi:hypothetical protein